MYACSGCIGIALGGAIIVSCGWGLFVSADVETDMDVHDRAMLYYRLLKQDINEVTDVLLITVTIS